MIRELETEFSTPETLFKAVFTEYDADAAANDPGLITRVARIMVEASTGERIPADAIITRRATGERYAVKTRRLSGVGILQFDLERIIDRKTSERKF
ncbi:MAG TPA: hypothetical protein VE954_28740 [Oligoflexus sp.]|uniref:hypothetical protein n=1 Tax=Oligoflexus sp. TaxID=1971216 RepID=UPI002D6A540C|nr:hypothetical protein [Oligoflexus sp.]HYX37108.1 hypothetical protein [Oligoflexus sp.]